MKREFCIEVDERIFARGLFALARAMYVANNEECDDDTYCARTLISLLADEWETPPSSFLAAAAKDPCS